MVRLRANFTPEGRRCFMLEEADAWKVVVILSQSKVSTAVGNDPLVLFRRLHEYQTFSQAGEHVESLFVLKLLNERRRI